MYVLFRTKNCYTRLRLEVFILFSYSCMQPSSIEIFYERVMHAADLSVSSVCCVLCCGQVCCVCPACVRCIISSMLQCNEALCHAYRVLNVSSYCVCHRAGSADCVITDGHSMTTLLHDPPIIRASGHHRSTQHATHITASLRIAAYQRTVSHRRTMMTQHDNAEMMTASMLLA